jgi:hypothetical protein
VHEHRHHTAHSRCLCHASQPVGDLDGSPVTEIRGMHETYDANPRRPSPFRAERFQLALSVQLGVRRRLPHENW